MTEEIKVTLTRAEIDAAKLKDVDVPSDAEKTEYQLFAIQKIESAARFALKKKYDSISLLQADIGNYPVRAWRSEILKKIAAKYVSEGIQVEYDIFFVMKF